MNREREPQAKNLLEAFVDQVVERHQTHEWYIERNGKRSNYSLFHAVGDTLDDALDRGIDIDGLFIEFRIHTTTRPQESELKHTLSQVDRWDELLRQACYLILVSEVQTRYPEVDEIDKKRFKKYDTYDTQ